MSPDGTPMLADYIREAVRLANAGVVGLDALAEQDGWSYLRAKFVLIKARERKVLLKSGKPAKRYRT